MTNILKSLVKESKSTSIYEMKFSVKNVLIELVLSSLSKTNFFSNYMLSGETSLRLFYDYPVVTDRLDFKKINNNRCVFDNYLTAINDSLSFYDIEVELINKNVDKYFLITNTVDVLYRFFPERMNDVLKLNKNENLKIDIEIDNNNNNTPFTWKYLFTPSPYSITVIDASALLFDVVFKILKGRINGRDLLIYEFLVLKGFKINFSHYNKCFSITDKETLLSNLNNIFQSLDHNGAKEEIAPFVKNMSQINLWSSDYFKQISKNIV